MCVPQEEAAIYIIGSGGVLACVHIVLCDVCMSLRVSSDTSAARYRSCSSGEEERP